MADVGWLLLVMRGLPFPFITCQLHMLFLMSVLVDVHSSVIKYTSSPGA